MKFKKVKTLFFMLGMSIVMLFGCGTKQQTEETTVETETTGQDRKVVLKEETSELEFPSTATETEVVEETETATETETEETTATAETETKADGATTGTQAPASKTPDASAKQNTSAEVNEILQDLQDSGILTEDSGSSDPMTEPANETPDPNVDWSKVVVE